MKSDKHNTAGRRKRSANSRQRVPAPQVTKGSRIIAATAAARSFSELLDRVCYRGETFVIERGGEPVCEMSHVKPARFSGADLLALLHSVPRPDPAYWDAVEEATRQEPSVPESRWER